MRKVSIITPSLMLLQPMSPAIGDEVVQIDKSGKGAVLCMWGIYQAASAVGLECHKGEDAAFQNELKRSLDRMDDFIIKNSKRPVSKADLESRRSEGLQQLRSSGNICIGDAAKIYSALQSAGAMNLEKQTTDLLSIPREPVMNPCL
ncbi:hypothetical protein FHS31_001446 [Sphingomonas vulcanisoli]|uniref:Uncharacterized protein n=1 Tax=Sphingomonas vulcanisoli TaxID=1658060 RepID=A0ABX0TQX7_9SPHN|nr:hypothetical protein [Sphingomonas vulcanisoli]NIJ07836.1 hypothetical protein [Sphingomonas vulcanisoli]